jgi:heptosyltransferase-2
LVIRFGALGDLCLLAWSLAKLATVDEVREDQRLTLVTKAGYADLLRRVPGVDEVVTLAGPRLRDLVSLARQLKSHDYTHIIDAHNNLRSHVLLTLLARRPRQRLAKDTAARLSLLLLRRQPTKLARTMRDRFDELFPYAQFPTKSSIPTGNSDKSDSSPPLANLAGSGPVPGPLLGIAPGARWQTKRWPTSHCAEFLRLFRDASPAPVRFFLGPQEQDWFPGSELARLARELANVQIHASQELTEVATGLADCSLLLTNDSGLLHLAEAVGTPVLALFGPTVSGFGYFPCLPQSKVIQRDLNCRPCSRNGKRPCWRFDQACLAQITAEQVLTSLLAMSTWPSHAVQEDPLV